MILFRERKHAGKRFYKVIMNLNVDQNCPCNHIEQVYRGKNLLVTNRLIKHNYTDTFVTEIMSGSTFLVQFFAVTSKEMTFRWDFLVSK